MKKIKFFAILMLCALVFSSCGTTSTVPITGRKHTLMVDDQQILSLSTQQYQEFLKENPISTDAANTAMVKRVGQRLASAVTNYLQNHGYAQDLQGFNWEFNLVKSNEVNAFCMPGGKIVVYEGLLPVTQNETSLAIVLGHEIAHAVAKHSAEQMSKQMRQQYGTQIVGSVLNQTVGSGVGNLAAQVAQMGFSFANLKYSRDDEFEADHMGIIFAAMAGYDPQQAIPFWERMSGGNSSKSSYLSDHPSDADRIAALKKWMPEALKYYNSSNPVQTTGTTTNSTNSTKSTKGTKTTKSSKNSFRIG